MIKGKRILIPGMAGSIGSELARQLCKNNKIFGIDQNETGVFDLTEELKQKGFWVNSRVGDIRDKSIIEDVFSDFKPQIVFHTAALKHVTPNEQYPLEAIQTNIIGTWNLINESKCWECVEKFVFISSDKVINSNSIMGATKKVGEIMVKNQGKGFVVVRFGNVLGSRGSVIPLWQAQIDKWEDLTVTHKDMTRFFMTIPEAVELVIEAAEQGKGGEIFILEMGDPVNILELAQKIINESGKNIGIKMIGIRPGETLTEKLMTEEESKVAIKKGKFYVIQS